MAPVHVIILAQGKQTRLPELKHPKHLLPLPACEETPIIYRTLCQLALLGALDEEHNVVDMSVTVVCSGALRARCGVDAKLEVLGRTSRTLGALDTYELATPGNSSLKGISNFLHTQDGPCQVHEAHGAYVVLLGDVVYSWACLHAIFAQLDNPRRMGFVGTYDLSASTGELWGVAWRTPARDTMMHALALALEKHPPFHDTYQCGQLRRWFWAASDLLGGAPADLMVGPGAAMRGDPYVAVDDYTDDVDVPIDLTYLPSRSVIAARDDANYGLVWRRP